MFNPLDALANGYMAQGDTIYDKQVCEAMRELENTTPGTPDADEARRDILLALNGITRAAFQDGVITGLRLARAEG